MKLSVAAYPHLRDRLVFVDARTGGVNRRWAVAEADDVAGTLTVLLMEDLLQHAPAQLRTIKVPMVVIDLDRATVLYNVGTAYAPARFLAEEQVGSWP